MKTVKEALAAILANASPLIPVMAPLDAALGRVLARDAVASLDLPPFPNSAVDGFAVRAVDLAAALPASPIGLDLLGETPAGEAPSVLDRDSACIRIMTGAPLPTGADAVVMKEDTELSGAGVLFHTTIQSGENVRPQGQDIARGGVAVPGGKLIRPSELAMLASLGLQEVLAYPRPRVAILTTGNEVVPPGQPLRPGQIYNSNRYMLQALAAASGFEVGMVEHLPDDLDGTIAQFAAAAPGHHAIISSGGVSVGEYDYVRTAVERLGEIGFWRVAMKPGKPLLYARIGECQVFGLPGNPVSSMVSFELFVRPALLKMAGHSKIHRPMVRSRLLRPLFHRPGREEYARVFTTRLGDEFVSTPHPGQGSHLVSSMVAANSLAVIPSEAGSLPEGARVDVLMTEWPVEE